MNTRRSRIVVVCILFGILPACISRAVHSNVPQFSEAVTLTTENSKDAFQIVDNKYMEVEASKLVVDYDRTGFDPQKIHHLLDARDLQVRLDLLNALQQYANSLSDVSSDSKLQEFDIETKAFGQSLETLTATAEFKKFAETSKADVNIATAAINALGRWFIERKRQKDLPQMIEQMQEPVRKIAELLQADIGNRPDAQGQGGIGLRAELWNEYMQAMIQESAFIDHNNGQLDALTRAAEIRKLPQLVDERDKADAALQQTAASMSKLVQAHSELLRAVQTKADLHADISSLISEGQRIKTFYESLQK
jgi:hypothetical protein